MITLYDIKNTQRPLMTISPFCWRARLCLNYKGIPYQTEWVDYSKIEEFAKAKGIPPTGTRPDGSPHYTIPFIYDSDKSVYISDSFRIAQYLDEAYPDTSKLIPAGTGALQAGWSQSTEPLRIKLTPLIGCKGVEYTSDEASRESGKEFIQKALNLPDWESVLEQARPEKQGWKEVEKVFKDYAKILDQGKVGGDWVMGERFTFADVVLAAMILWTRSAWGKESEQYKLILGWDNGRWKRYIENVESYTNVH
ncbi:hypothetical protein CC1G_14829 [Coprinopsis cinerea okayama7|uniref:GST N-terminal domain-containing protein n=1 Tax=Coprinopsis cinerea (strain Okayama-7 / 130 / ATCC MYA-4618 / FGSC 9003) TaxID=240176 RepID=D6RNV4_COPC7|nr:hypothetical protein CC1G_14829 [Coprinopsis cinerea okayama7\|eukprot:XP_002910850.1 hypothetical protein CC1G_14829 [Coprinopsis cinerea okayama7\